MHEEFSSKQYFVWMGYFKCKTYPLTLTPSIFSKILRDRQEFFIFSSQLSEPGAEMLAGFTVTWLLSGLGETGAHVGLTSSTELP